MSTDWGRSWKRLLTSSQEHSFEVLSSRVTYYCLDLGSPRSRAWGKIEPWVWVVCLGSNPRNQEWRSGKRNTRERKAYMQVRYWVGHQHRWWPMHREPSEMPPRILWPEDERETHLSISLHPLFFKTLFHVVHTWAPYRRTTSIMNLET